MPYHISIKNNVIQITLNGHITGNDLQAIIAETARYECTPVVPPRVTDLREITNLDVSFPDVMTIAQQRRVLRFQNSFKSAIIAQDDLHLGYARMFQTLNDNPQIYIKIFADRQAADKWVAEEEKPAAKLG